MVRKLSFDFLEYLGNGNAVCAAFYFSVDEALRIADPTVN